MNFNEAVDRVKKLHSLAANNANENEQQAANAAADRIIQEFRIEQAHLEAKGEAQAEEMSSRVVSQGGRRTLWREILIGALTSQYSCVWFLSSGRLVGRGYCEYTIVGRDSDIKIVDYMFTYFENLTLRLGKWHTEGRGRGYGKAWQSGFATGIAKQYLEMKARVSVQANEKNASSALVVLETRARDAKMHMNVLLGGSSKKASAITGGRNWSARQDGYMEGQKVDVNISAPSGVPKLST